MRIQPSSHIARLLPGSRRTRAVLLAGAVAAVSLAAIACSGDDADEPSATLTAGAVATATATTQAASPTAQASSSGATGGSLIPSDTATPTPTPGASGSAAPDAPQPIAMFDLAPCGNDALYDEVELPGHVPALTYKDVPSGTPILFPFEHGNLRHVDAKEGAISLIYDIDGVGVFTIKAAGSTSLIRNLREPVAGTVIGYFGDVFGEEERSEFAETQVYAVVGTEEMHMIGDEYYAGQPLDPEITDCLPLP